MGWFQHIVFGLADAMPSKTPHGLSRPDLRGDWADDQLDRGMGCSLLAKPANARLVQASLLHDDGVNYTLAAWCIMPTHVHALIELRFGSTLADIVQAWKSATSHAINKIEGRKGRLWRREYYDRFMRSEDQLANTVAYIESNPVAARLCERPTDWPFSSACLR